MLRNSWQAVAGTACRAACHLCATMCVLTCGGCTAAAPLSQSLSSDQLGTWTLAAKYGEWAVGDNGLCVLQPGCHS